MSDKYFIECDLLAPEELIDKVSKTRSLNNIVLKIDKLLDRTDNSKVISKLMTIKLLIDDAYKIDMYKFQFKIFLFSLDKEIKNIDEYVSQNES